MPISQDRMIRLAKAGRALIEQLDAMREMVKAARQTVVEGDISGATNQLDEAINLMQPHRSVIIPIELEAQHFERNAARNAKIASKQANYRARAAMGYTEPPRSRHGVPADHAPPNSRGYAMEDIAPEPELYIPPPSVGRIATPQGPDFARIAEPTTPQGLTLADYLADPSLEPAPMPPRQPPTLSALGVRGKGDRADVVTSVPDDVNATPELGADPFAAPRGGGAGE